MSEKSYVSMERQGGLVCCTRFDTGNLLLDKRLRASFDRYTTTGWGLCDEHRRLFEEGYVALVECDPERSGLTAGGQRLKPEQAFRTGELAHLKREALEHVFDVSISDKQACVFVETGVIEKLVAMSTPRPN